MSKTLAMVRRRLNSYNPTTRKIPPEILIMIASNLRINAALITKATHVCHHWRAILLSCPGLWTHLNFAQENQALSFLHRSKPFPIHVDLTSITPSQSLIDLLCQHSARVNTLRVGRFDGLHKLFRLPLASLRTLEVFTPDEWFQIRAVRSVAREFIALTTLAIEYSPGGLTFRGSHVTRLRVAISNSSSEVAELPNLFRSCVLLEELEIENKGELEGGLRLPPDEVIPLPHLRSLTQTLHCDQHRTGIIDNLHLPLSCSVVLRCVGGLSNSYPPPRLPNLRDRSRTTNVKRIKVVYTGRCLEGKASMTVDFINDRGAQFTAITEFLNYAIDLSDEDPARTAVTELLMPGAKVLCVDGHRYVKLESHKHLTTLILSGPVLYLYLELLVEFGSDHCDAFESLHTLVLFVDPSPLAPDLTTDLLEVAQARAEAGFPFRSITFAYPSALDDLAALEGLRGCVERVELLLGDDALDWNHDKYFLGGI